MKISIRIDRSTPNVSRFQVVRYENRKPIVLKHIGTAHTEEEHKELQTIAEEWILHNPQHPQLFPYLPESSAPILLKDCRYMGILHTFTYELLHSLCSHFKFTTLKSPLLVDLVIMRIFEPSSKRQSLKHLTRYFGKEHTEKQLYQSLPQFIKLKTPVEERIVAIAKSELSFNFSFVLYDVTTLYFESFESDDLRKPGFSKDNKGQQPQIVIGLMVTPEGFPVYYEVFSGNTFEGHTFLPSILAFKSLHQIKTLTIVADAAMLSVSTMLELHKQGLTYIVGARLGNVKSDLFKKISEGLQKENGSTYRTTTPLGDLVTDFSQKRYAKDLSDLNKQIKRAEAQVQSPSKVRKAKFVSTTEGKMSVNTELIERTKKLLGVKGYYTNLREVSNTEIISHYRSLWNVEKAFRIAKSDLATRPIFHFKEENVRAHVLICVMALAISKYIEMKTGMSIRAVLDECSLVTDAQLVHGNTGRKVVMRVEKTGKVVEIEGFLSH